MHIFTKNGQVVTTLLIGHLLSIWRWHVKIPTRMYVSQKRKNDE